jgi:hypothetical protein
MTPQQAAAVARFDRHMLEATGHTYDDYEQVRDSGPTSLAHVQLYGKLVDESGTAELLEEWAASERKSNAGRKPHLSFRAVLILHLMHAAEGSIRYQRIARTLFARLTPQTREYLDINIATGNRADWYQRYWRSLNRLLALVSPWEVPRNTFLSAAAYQRALTSYSQERRDRMDEVMNRLTHASVRRLPAEVRETYRGNLALDATAIKLVGRPNPTTDNLWSTRQNLDAMSGRYSRHDDHKGKGADDDEAAWEVETTVTVANAPGQPDSFPVLTTGLTMHHPGHTKHGALIAVKFHTRLFDQRGYIMVDRLYNYMKSWRFQNPTRKMRYRHVYDMRSDQLGKKGAVGDVICVEGSLYLRWMPKDLIDARKDYVKKRIDRATYEARMASRTRWRLKDKGVPDSEGRQRFLYPDTRKLMFLDPVTRKPLRDKPKLNGTFTLHPDGPEALRIIKHLQAFEYKSEEWKKWYGLRSHVEANNQFMKDDAHADLGNRLQRRPRGYAYQALAVAVVATVSNMRRVVTFLKNAMDREVPKKVTRARRRTDEHGNRLAPRDATVVQQV